MTTCIRCHAEIVDARRTGVPVVMLDGRAAYYCVECDDLVFSRRLGAADGLNVANEG